MPAPIVDLLVESESVVYVASGANVFKSVVTGWSPVNAKVGAINMLNIADNGDILVGGTAMVSISTDGAASFSEIPVPVPGGGAIYVVADKDYEDNDLIFTGSAVAGAGINRWTVGTNTAWEPIRPGAAIGGGAGTLSGMAMREDVLYGSWSTGAFAPSGAERSLTPDAPSSVIALTFRNVLTAGAAAARFNRAPQALKVSGTGSDCTLWAIDTLTGAIMAYNDEEIGYAVIVAGQGGWREEWGFDHGANNAYRVLRNLGFSDDHIFYLNSNGPQDIDEDGNDEVDAPASLSDFENAMNEVKSRIGNSGTLIIYLMGHGLPSQFLFDESCDCGYSDGCECCVTDLKLKQMLDEFPNGIRMLIFINSCYSGSFITSPLSGISDPNRNRIIITGAHDDNERWGIFGTSAVRSSDRFWGNLNDGLSVKDAFITDTWPGEWWHLWLDDNGDKTGHPPNNLADDGSLAAITQIGVPGTENLELTHWLFVGLRSPGELRVYDSQNRVTGLVNGEVKEEIPDSIYDEQNEIVVIYSPSDTYRYEVVGTDEDTYGLDITFIEDGEAAAFATTEVPITTGAKYEYTIDWAALSEGEKGVTIRVDSDGDGEFEETIVTTPPYTPSDPSPAGGATGVSLNTPFSWKGGDPDQGDNVTYKVYLGTSENPPLVSEAQSGTAYVPGSLGYSSKYYWKVVARDNHEVGWI